MGTDIKYSIFDRKKHRVVEFKTDKNLWKPDLKDLKSTLYKRHEEELRKKKEEEFKGKV